MMDVDDLLTEGSNNINIMYGRSLVANLVSLNPIFKTIFLAAKKKKDLAIGNVFYSGPNWPFVASGDISATFFYSSCMSCIYYYYYYIISVPFTIHLPKLTHNNISLHGTINKHDIVYKMIYVSVYSSDTTIITMRIFIIHQ